MEALRWVGSRKNIPIHLDGARIWNAATFTQQSVDRLSQSADSITACLSKGLGAPAGSLLIGTTSLISKARRMRKVLGGGMRQIGVLAAAGLQALDDFDSGILLQDHKRAKTLAVALREVPGLEIDPDDVETNMLLIRIDIETCSSGEFLAQLKERGVLALPRGNKAFRLVLHRDITDDDVNFAATAIRETANQFWQASTSIAALESQAFESSSSDLSVPAMPASLTVSQHENHQNHQNQQNQQNQQVLEAFVNTTSAHTKSAASIPFEEVSVYGMSVSEEGFCVFLQGMINERILKVLVSPEDPMVEGLDKEQVESSEAVTLLQLLQGIDVETFLPREALSLRFGDSKQKFKLRRVMIGCVGSKQDFTAKLCGYPRKANMTEPLINLMEDSKGKLIDTSKAKDLLQLQRNNQIHSESMSDSHALSFVQEDDSNNFIGNPQIKYLLQSTLNDTSAPSLGYKEVEIKNAFEAIALAMRHRAAIEVRSELFQDERFSYTVEELRSDFPKLLESSINTNPVDGQPDRIMQEPSFAQRIMERLQRLFYEASRQKNERKAASIASKIDFIIKMLGADGDAVIYPPGYLESSNTEQLESEHSSSSPSEFSATLIKPE